MPSKREARRSLVSGRATVWKDERSIPRRYDMVRDDPRRWELGCRWLVPLAALGCALALAIDAAKAVMA